MSAAVLLALAVAASPLMVSPSNHGRVPPIDCGPAVCSLHETPEAALAPVLASRPTVLAVGEVHQIEGASAVPSSIKRFTGLLPLFKGLATDLVVETWITDGKCGETETKAVAEIREETARPAQTGNEVLDLGIAARGLGIMPHVLNVSCAEYATLLGTDRTLDDGKLLRMVAGKLSELALDLAKVRAKAKGARPMIVVYGGALHNDRAPAPDDAPYCFGPAVAKATAERYAELDLYVPEYIRDDEDLAKEPWFKAMDAKVRGGATLLVRTRPGSWVVVFPWTHRTSK